MSSIFGIFYKIFGALLRLCSSISGNYYIIALFIFSLIVQIALFPFAIKQQKSTVKMAKLSPKIALIKEKYKGRNDRVTQQKVNTEIQEIYQKEGYSPYAGCLPLLIQLPILFILWGVIRMPLTYTTSSNVDLYSQYEVAVKIYDGAIAAIKESGLLADTNIGEISGEESEITGEISNNDTSLIVSEDTSIVAVRNVLNSYLTQYSGRITYLGAKLEGNRWDGKKFTENKDYEFELTRFIVNNERDRIINNLIKAGVDEEIVRKHIPDSLTFNSEFVESIPKFGFIGNTTLLDIPKEKGISVLIIIPLLVFITSFLSGVITKKLSSAPAMTEGPQPGGGFMKWGLPLFSTYISWATLPSAVGIYWIYRTVFGIGQSFILAKMYPIPKMSEEELAELKKQLKAKKKKVITIEVDEDDDSYDNLIIKTDKKDSPNTKYQMLSPDDDKPKSKIERAPLKEDNPEHDNSEDDTDED